MMKPFGNAAPVPTYMLSSAEKTSIVISLVSTPILLQPRQEDARMMAPTAPKFLKRNFVTDVPTPPGASIQEM